MSPSVSQRCFRCTEAGTRPEALRWIARYPDEAWQVSNVTPGRNMELITVMLGPVSKTARDWLSDRAANALNTVLAIQGITHPMDSEWWHRFIILSHVDRCELDAETLQRPLTEEGGWAGEVSQDLAMGYSVGRSLLEAYDTFNEKAR